MKLTTTVLFAALALAPLPLAATSYVMVPDEDLADQAAAIVEARVLSVENAPTAGTIATDYLIEVDRVLKGDLAGSHLVVRVPGGVRPDGTELVLWGVPRFNVGEQPLLFLMPGDEGTYRVLHLMLGAFHDAILGGRRALVRDLSEAAELQMPGEPEGARARYRRPRDRDRFVAWLVDRALGTSRPPEYFLAPGVDGVRPSPDFFAFFDFNGFKLRWFEFDAGTSEGWRVYAAGQPGLTLQETVNAFKTSLAAWNADPSTNIDYVYLGTTASPGAGLGDVLDGKNTIVFDDATHDINDPFDCGSGGTLALGGVFPTGSPARVRDGTTGEKFKPIAEGDIVTNAGIECFFNRSANRIKAAEELFAHELGHTLGLGHSTVGNALMYPYIHNDGRGAALHADDRGGIFVLYGVGAVPIAPSNLAAEALTATSLRLSWQDNSENETAFRVEWKPPGAGSFQLLKSLSANIREYVVTGLTENNTYSFRVRAANAIGVSPPSNEVTVEAMPPPPTDPSNLTAAAVSSTAIALTWEDNSTDETGFAVESRSPLGDYQVVLITAPDVTGAILGGLIPGLPYTFRVQARNDHGASAYSAETSATPVDPAPSTCVADAETLCLIDGRFQVRVQWRNQYLPGDHGVGHARPFPGSALSGQFWFFGPDNIELIVKALDAQSFAGSFWVFYGALSNVEYWITVVDTERGMVKTYHNPPGNLCGNPDTNAFPADDPAAVGTARAATPAPSEAAAAASDPCQPGGQALCLADGRFEVTVDWTDQRSGDHGIGVPIPDSDTTGFFWFFNSQNVELAVKTPDFRSSGGNYGLFYGALSDVEYTITVRDTLTGLIKSYNNAPGEFCGQADTVGFPDPN